MPVVLAEVVEPRLDLAVEVVAIALSDLRDRDCIPEEDLIPSVSLHKRSNYPIICNTPVYETVAGL